MTKIDDDFIPEVKEGIFTGTFPWVKIVFALGFPTVVSLILLLFVLDIQKKQNDTIHAAILNNQTLIVQMNNKVDEAGRTMRMFAEQSSARDKAIVQLLFRICYQNANSKVQSEACLEAIRTAGE